MKFINKIINFLLQLYLEIIAVIPTELGVKVRYFTYKMLLKKTTGTFRIDSHVTIIGFDKIELGNNVRIQKNSFLHAIDANLSIGDDSFLGTNSQLSAVRGDIKIGSNCLIASNCVFRPDNHKIDRIDIPINQQGYDIGDIVLEDDVWIGANSVVLKDVLLSKGSVVAAGSVVNKKVSPYDIVAGVPAKIVKNRKSN